VLALLLAGWGWTAGQAADSPLARYLGALSCASSSCHGGAGEKRDQFITWEQRDVHRRAYSTLVTARSAQIARAAGLGRPETETRCTVCHAPFADVPAERRGGLLEAAAGVSCETCHGPAEPWLRSHTRRDFTAADRAADGLRPLENLYTRANACVACHEHVEGSLLTAGHPELRFELDGQSRWEPRHWQEPAGYSGAQAWLVGQAVALRELEWHCARVEQSTDAKLVERRDALRWLLAEATAAVGLSALTGMPDELAQAAANRPWAAADTAALLRRLSQAAGAFRGSAATVAQHSRRADRLVLALDRLLAASDRALEGRANAELNALLKLAQVPAEFSASAFADALDRLAAKLK
jgi:hypothetical protein